MTYIVDKKRNQFFRKLIRTIIVRTVCYNGRHTICVMKSTNKVITTCLTCRIRTMRLIFGFLREEGPVKFQCPIYFIGGNMIETFPLILFRQGFPIQLGCLKQSQCTHHIGLCKSKRIFDTSVHMTLGGKMDNTIHLISHQ